MNESQKTNELQQIGKQLMNLELAWGTAGNISSRNDENSFYITKSGTKLGDLGDNDFVLVPNEMDNKKPSKEYNMHKAIYDNRSEMNAVIHCAPFYSTLISCSSLELTNNTFVEAMYYLEKVVNIPYKHPGSLELAKEVEKKVTEANVFILENHGILVCDVNMKEALMSVETLEFAAKMLITAKNSNIEMDYLTDDVVRDFLNNAGYKSRREWY